MEEPPEAFSKNYGSPTSIALGGNAMEALIIVDVQNDFCTAGALAVPGGEEVVPRINALKGQFPLAIATQDWHPRGHVSFASTHGKNPGESVETPQGTQILWPDHCIQGTRGADFHPDLDLDATNLLLRKGTSRDLDSYSAFLENDRTTSTGLAAYLGGMGITKVFLCGLATDFCVFFSALDALEAGFETTVIEDAVRGVDIPKGNLAAALETMEQRGIHLIGSQSI